MRELKKILMIILCSILLVQTVGGGLLYSRGQSTEITDEVVESAEENIEAETTIISTEKATTSTEANDDSELSELSAKQDEITENKEVVNEDILTTENDETDREKDREKEVTEEAETKKENAEEVKVEEDETKDAEESEKIEDSQDDNSDETAIEEVESTDSAKENSTSLDIESSKKEEKTEKIEKTEKKEKDSEISDDEETDDEIEEQSISELESVLSSGNIIYPGWKQEGSKWWYLNADGTYPKSAWKYIGENWFFFDAGGYMKTGWLLNGGKWYYLETSGAMARSKWVDNVYYIKSDGTMAVNEWVDGDKYYVGADGKWVPGQQKIVAGWKKDNTGWWYLNADGTYPKNAWKYIGQVWYHFNASGYMQTGWIKDGNYWYYLESSGAMATNKWIGGIYGYYVKSNGAMATSEWVDGDRYYVGPDGRRMPEKEAKCMHPDEFLEWTVIQEGTCDTTERDRCVCKKCGDVIVANYDTGKYKHLRFRVSTIKSATYTETGIRKYTCMLCPYSYTEEIPIINCEHKNTTAVLKDGIYWSKCDECEKFLEDINDEIIDCVHSEFDSVTIKRATYKQTGIKKYKCKTCPYSYNEEIPVLSCSHTNTIVVYQDEKFWTLCRSCDICLGELEERDEDCTHSEYTNRKYLVQALGENVDGIWEFRCTNCGELTSTVTYPGYQTYEILYKNGDIEIVDTVCGYYDRDFSNDLFTLTNIYREENNKNDLNYADNLQWAADIRAREAAYLFSHNRPDGSKWYTLDPIKMNGENLATGYKEVETTMIGWKNSPGHNENLLEPLFKSLAVSTFVKYTLPADETAYPSTTRVSAQSFSCTKEP